MLLLSLVFLTYTATRAYSFSPQIILENCVRGVTFHQQNPTSLNNDAAIKKVFLSAALAISITTATTSPCIALEEEYESPTIFTGETVMVSYQYNQETYFGNAICSYLALFFWLISFTSSLYLHTL